MGRCAWLTGVGLRLEALGIFGAGHREKIAKLGGIKNIVGGNHNIGAAVAVTYGYGVDSVAVDISSNRPVRFQYRQAVCTFDVTVEIPAPPIPKLQVTKFLAFGDSLTAGENGINGVLFIDYGYEYPTILQSLLNARYTTQTSAVINRGAPGESAYEGSLRLPRELDASRPDALLLLEGVNDFYGLAVLSRDGPPVIADVRRYLLWDIQQAKQRNIKVFLSTLTPQIFGRSRAWMVNGDLNLLIPMNDAIRSLARDEGVFLVDAFRDLSANPSLYLSDDGLHLSREGRDGLARSFLSAIQQQLEVPQGRLRQSGR